MVNVKEKGFEYAKRLYLDRLAPDFSPFQFIDLDETQLSAILAWLLDPKGSHGQGEKFLSLFLNKLSANWSPKDCKLAEVKTESWIGGGRIDIDIKSGSRRCVIENKPWAGDQPLQLDRYFRWLDLLSRFDGKRAPSEYPLVYLTADGSPPTLGSLSDLQQQERFKDGQLHCWAFRGELLDWLIQCKTVCRADRVSVFIDELARYIRGRFGELDNMTMQDQLVTEIATSPAMVASAMQVIFAGDAIREKLLLKLRNELTFAVEREGWSLDWNILWNSRQSGMKIDFSKHLNCVFCLEFEKTHCADAAYGAYKKDTALIGDGGVRAALFAANLCSSNGSTEDEYWPWWRHSSPQDELLPFQQNWGLSVQPWVAIADGTMASILVAAARRFRDVLAPIGGESCITLSNDGLTE